MTEKIEQLPQTLANPRGPEELLTKAQVAQLCQVTERTIDAWMNKGLIVYLRIGRTVRFRWSDLQAHLDALYRVARRMR